MIARLAAESLLPLTLGTTQALGLGLGLRVKVAVTDVALFMVTAQVPVPLQPPPDQPLNVEPEPGVAVNETAAPDANACEHVLGHEIPAGVLTTEPEPEPAKVRERQRVERTTERPGVDDQRPKPAE